MQPRQIKHFAKAKMRAPVPNAIVIGLVFYLILSVLGKINQAITMGPFLNEAMGDPERLYQLLESGYTPDISPVGYLLYLAIEIVSTILSFGFMIYCLSISRDCPAGIGTLFDGFGLFFKVIWLYIRMGLIIFLWSLLFVVPGIIAAYNYRQAAYILIDHPEWSAKQCMRESKRIMAGNKFDLFWLDLSFIGWSLLSLFPFVSVYSIPFTETSYAIFYNQVAGRSPDDPETPALSEKAPWEY